MIQELTPIKRLPPRTYRHVVQEGRVLPITGRK
jgi:hypothetical protein